MDDINYGSLTEEDMISKIDVYSLGIQVPLLFYFYSNIKKPYIKSSLINEFYDLFKDMTHPNPLKRITPSQTYNIYMKLMEIMITLRMKRILKEIIMTMSVVRTTPL